MKDELMEWAYSAKIRDKILNSSSLKEFVDSCTGVDSHWASFARIEPAYYTVKRFPSFNEQKMCTRTDITKLSDIIVDWKTKTFQQSRAEEKLRNKGIDPGIYGKPEGPYLFFWNDEKDLMFRNHLFLEQLFVKYTPEFAGYYKGSGFTCLRAINREFNGETKWVAIYGEMKFGNELLTYLDTTTEFFDAKTKRHETSKA